MATGIRKILKSRPDPEQGLVLEELSDDELKLMASFLWITRLGKGVSPFRDAAFSLLTKIEELKGDKFCEDAAIDVDLKVDIIDSNGNTERSVGYYFLEVDV